MSAYQMSALLPRQYPLPFQSHQCRQSWGLTFWRRARVFFILIGCKVRLTASYSGDYSNVGDLSLNTVRHEQGKQN